MTRKDAPIQRLLVVLPTWVGDVVMATPTLRALRQLYPQAHIAYLIKPYARSVIDGCPWCDAMIADDTRLIGTASRLRRERFDAAVLLPNSFRSALLVRLAGIPRRIGYDRDARGLLLTDRLLPLRDGLRYVPYPALRYYLAVAEYLGAADPDPAMALFTQPQDDEAAGRLLADAGVTRDAHPLVMLNPGGRYGQAKLWHADRFARVADRLIDEHGATVLVNGAPSERAVLDEVHKAAQHDLVDLPSRGSNLTLLKSLVKRCDLMITNDTGPRHFAAALNVPVVTVFGPTWPEWTTIDFAQERIVRVDVPCGPCQLKVCPKPERICMTRIDSDMVMVAANELLQRHYTASGA
jgi:heptosyltransferase-2